MINFKDSEEIVEDVEEANDYMNEEPLDEELDEYDEEEKEGYTCD